MAPLFGEGGGGQNQLFNHARGHYEEHFCKIILNLDQ